MNKNGDIYSNLGLILLAFYLLIDKFTNTSNLILGLILGIVIFLLIYGTFVNENNSQN